MTILHAIILALVEGLTEFIPVSSTGHLILAQKILQIPTSSFTQSFDLFIQLSAILAVLFAYKDRFLKDFSLYRKLIIAFLPTGILGFLLYPFIKNTLLVHASISAYALIFGGLFLLSLEKFKFFATTPITLTNLTPRKLLQIGLIQSLSMIPGVSRSAASIVGGLSVGLSKVHSVEFSFFLALPTIASATLYDLYQSPPVLSNGNLSLLIIGSLVSFVSSLLAIKFFLKIVSRYSFIPFAIYRIIVGLLFLLMIN